MSAALHVHHFGPSDGPPVLVLHGVSGHGARWWAVAEQLPHVRVIAPDLRGHGRSPDVPPWSIEQHVEDLLAVLDAEGVESAVVVGHSFGGAIAVHLARAAPERVAGLVLLDSAMGVTPRAALDSALAYCIPSIYTDVEHARTDQREAWSGASAAAVDAEVAHHLTTLSDGRLTWRISTPAMVACWSELARQFVVPPAGMRTVLVRAGQVDPPYVTPEFVAACTEALGPKLRVHAMESGHMIEQEQPAAVAELIDGMVRTVHER
ncbi:MAG: alpha/beta fold hydrolase [Mycobacteriaceae bacterium]